jgi:hypothetical protein
VTCEGKRIATGRFPHEQALQVVQMKEGKVNKHLTSIGEYHDVAHLDEAHNLTLIHMPRRHACIFAFLFDFISILFDFSDSISFIFAYISFICSLLVVFHTVALLHDCLMCISHPPNP